MKINEKHYEIISKRVNDILSGGGKSTLKEKIENFSRTIIGRIIMQHYDECSDQQNLFDKTLCFRLFKELFIIYDYIIPADLKKFSIAKHIFLCNVENILNIKANFLNRNKFIVSYNTRCSRIKKNLKKLGTNFEKKDEFVEFKIFLKKLESDENNGKVLRNECFISSIYLNEVNKKYFEDNFFKIYNEFQNGTDRPTLIKLSSFLQQLMNLYDGIPYEAQITYDHPLECVIKYLFDRFDNYTNKKYKINHNFNERKIDTGIRKIHTFENMNSTYICYFQTCIVFSSSDLMDILQKFIAINLIFSKTLIDISSKPLFQFILVMAGFEKYAKKCRGKLLEYMEDLKEFCEKIIEEKLA